MYQEAYEEIRRSIRQDLLPVFLGSTPSAHRLAWTLFRHYGTLSFVADRRRSCADLWNPATRFLPLPPSGDPRLSAELLCDLCRENRNALPLLIVCKESLRSIVRQESEKMESRFILLEPSSLLCCAPIAEFPQ